MTWGVRKDENWGREMESKDQSRVMIDKTKRLEVCHKTASIMAFKLYHNCNTTDSHTCTHNKPPHTQTFLLHLLVWMCFCKFPERMIIASFPVPDVQLHTFVHQSLKCSLPYTEQRRREHNWQEAKLAAPNLKQIINSRNWNDSFDVLSFILVLTAGCSLRLF